HSLTAPSTPTCTMCGIFFFSSRRRHTRFSRDWSSDVCSSDLMNLKKVHGLILTRSTVYRYMRLNHIQSIIRKKKFRWGTKPHIKIGRASCRERVEISEVAETVKNKRHRAGDVHTHVQVEIHRH